MEGSFKGTEGGEVEIWFEVVDIRVRQATARSFKIGRAHV